ncbi:MAG TPA: M3 family metallopeptidase [Candidatus Polarisedimenticolia bacterium]|nr:M3 family metallopeptidase [Candidatus Polarisedimenticolia bacterium]
MIRFKEATLAGLVALMALPGGAAGAAGTPAGTSAVEGAPVKDNLLLADWKGPYGGVPAFDRMSLPDLKAALEAGMKKNLEEYAVIAADSAPPTFANTIEAMERAGRDLDRAQTYYSLWAANLSSPDFRKIQEEMAPRLAEFRSQVTQNTALFARIKAVWEARATAGLRPDQKRLVELIYDGFARDGATLTGAARDRHAAINARLAELYTKFADNVLADEEGYVTWLTKDQVGGLPESVVKSAAAAAAERGRKDAYAITNTRSSVEPFLTYATDRALREKVWRTYYARGDNGDAHDNNAVIAEILALRNERAKLLGYPNYAAWQLENKMAKTPDRAFALMNAVWPAALARVREEVADMQAVADKEKAGITIAGWDYRFYAEKVRRAKYDLDSDEVKQYLQLEKLREGLFYVAGELFGFDFKPIPDGRVPVFHPDVKVWEVTDRASGKLIGLWYLDPFARAGKRSGAWATTYRDHETFDGLRTTLGSNNSNFVKGAPGEPVLISWSDTRTLFHEFGHALHYFSSNVAYPTLNGGVRDYTEFQSQLLERWVLTDPVINRYLVNVRTGKPMPKELVAKIRKASTFNRGFDTTEYLASALMDMKYHTVDPTGIDPRAFEKAMLAELKMPSEIVMRHRSTQFTHAFSGEGYAAGYYGYLWADVLTADATEAFEEAPGGFYDKPLAKKLVANLFAVRNAVDPAEAYRAFRGRDARIDALMRDRGFPVPASTHAAGG